MQQQHSDLVNISHKETILPSVDEQLGVIMRGVIKCHTGAELKKKIECAINKRQPLRIKLGIDPSSSDIHIGHSVVLRKLRQFQDLGHKAILVIGTSTAQVGDPSGQNKTRPQIILKDVESFAQTYLEQIGSILDQSQDKLEIVKNGNWFEPMHFADFMCLLSRLTISQVLTRDDFKQRIKKGREVRLHELIYPAMQGWDSVMVRADIELGGHDQLFNLLVGRDFQRQEGQEPQVCLMMPLLNGLDGRKMSKSYGNYIGVNFPPEEIFGKTMAIPDKMMRNFFTLLTDVKLKEIDMLVDVKRTHPNSAKCRLAWELTNWLYDSGVADKAQTHFDTIFVKRGIPDNLPKLILTRADLDDDGAVWIVALITKADFAKTNSEARRLITGGGVSIDGVSITNPKANVIPTTGGVLKVGKRRLVRIVLTGVLS